jgi:hypothetical protein
MNDSINLMGSCEENMIREFAKEQKQAEGRRAEMDEMAEI